MTKDIAPELIEQITAEYNKLVSEDKTLKTLLKKIKSKSATYKDVQEYAIRTSELLSKVLDNNLSSDILPDGRLYYNIATRIFNEVLGSNGLHGDISKYAAEVQKIINEKAGIGLKAVQAKVNEDRINGIVDVVSGKDNFDKIKYMVNEPIILYGISIADDTLKENFEFQSEAGLRPRIIRMPTSKCCDWCAERAGTFDYNEVIEMGNKVFQRHRFCRCIVEYDAGDGFRENVHTKKTRRVEEVEQRKRVGLETPLKKNPEEILKKVVLSTPQNR